MVRPARPLRCVAEARLVQVVTRVKAFRRQSYRMRRCRPTSRVAVTLGKVRELSAMLEAKTMWAQSLSGAPNAPCMSSRGISECMPNTFNRSELSREVLWDWAEAYKLVMSASPGKKTSTVQPGLANRKASSTIKSSECSMCCDNLSPVATANLPSANAFAMAAIRLREPVLSSLPKCASNSSRYTSCTEKGRSPTTIDGTASLLSPPGAATTSWKYS
mmetsp:Transcript_158879/g.509473  ORF Transcript_158879/g.509473 Transcript_158879/m.509473 type:complete len:218 (-) Transcript_158879:3102-3755(-)